MNIRRLVLLALLVAQALVLSIVESWIPIPGTPPGVKLGLANIVTLIAIIFLDSRSALLVVLLRTLLASLYTGSPMIFLFSLAGGVLSTVVMAVLYKRMSKNFSITGISIAGAVSHNLGQMAVASAVTRELAVLSYLPVLLISGIIMGFFIGICTVFLSKALKKTRIFD
jgi:heptaprenyl diphosphate synthase